jgi:hypothetical protein
MTTPTHMSGRSGRIGPCFGRNMALLQFMSCPLDTREDSRLSTQKSRLAERSAMRLARNPDRRMPGRRLLKSDAPVTCGVMAGFAWRRLRAGLAVY